MPDGVVLRVERVPDPRGDVALVGVEVPEAVGVEGDRKLVGDDEVDSDALADPCERNTPAATHRQRRSSRPAPGMSDSEIASGSVGTSWPMTTNWRIRGGRPRHS